MTQVRLWQIVSRAANALIFADAAGNLTNLPAGKKEQVLVINANGIPEWVDNAALAAALQASTDATDVARTAKAYTDAQIAALVDGAPVALNTLKELAEKMTGEDSAIVALLTQVDGKAGKAEVDTLLAQAKQDSATASKAYTDNAVSSAQSAIAAQLTQQQAVMLAQAAGDAGLKADTAQAKAIQSAGSYTDQKLADTVTQVTQDSAAKASAAASDAVANAATYTDRSLASFREAIPDSFQATGTSTACFLSASGSNDAKQVESSTPVFETGIKPIDNNTASIKVTDMLVADNFTEITGAGIDGNEPSLNVKLLFINGIAVADGWTALRTDDNRLAIRFTDKFASRVFDDPDNVLMLLAEYTSYHAIRPVSTNAA